MVAAAELLHADREPHSPASTGRIRDHVAALRSHGTAREMPRGTQNGRVVEALDGHRRQCNRHYRYAGEGGPGRARDRFAGPPRFSGEADAERPAALQEDGRGARALDHRSLGRPAVQGQAAARRAAESSQESRAPTNTVAAGEPLMSLANYQPLNFLWRIEGRVGVITLNRPERKNPLTFESYAELRDLFRRLGGEESVKAVVITGAGRNFCSGGDVHDIIGPLTRMNFQQLLDFTRMTGDLVKAMRHCPQPI